MAKSELKKLSPTHRDAIRRLIVGEKLKDVAEELGVDRQTVSTWMKDPLFRGELDELQLKANDRAYELSGRLGAREILDGAAEDAAQLCVDVVVEETIGDKLVPLKLRLDSARDILDRTGFKPVDKKIVGHTEIGKLISDAYKKDEEQVIDA